MGTDNDYMCANCGKGEKEIYSLNANLCLPKAHLVRS